MMLDEIQTGFGRTGRWFGFEHDGIRPDVVTLAKAMGNGMPVGACWARRDVAAVFEPGDHGSTYSGTAIATAAVNAVIGEMRRLDAPALAAEKGARLAAGARPRCPASSACAGGACCWPPSWTAGDAASRLPPAARPRPGRPTPSRRPRCAWPRRSTVVRRRDRRGASAVIVARALPECPMTRHLLEVTDLTAAELRAVLDLAAAPPAELGRPLDGQGVALIFEKPSPRTRHSMEMAVVQLGGHPVYTRGDEIGIDVREPVEDVVRILRATTRSSPPGCSHHEVLERMVARRRRADRQHALRPRPPAAGAGRRAHDGAAARPAGRPHRGLGRRLQQRRPLARRGLRPARRPPALRLPGRLRPRRGRARTARRCSARPASSTTTARPRPSPEPTPCTPTRGCRWVRRPTRPPASRPSRGSPSTAS